METMPLMPRRVHICGCSGSGKTTLGKRLAEFLGVPFVELDGLFHLPNWESTPRDEFLAKVAAAVDCDGWVVDGNYSYVRAITWERVDAVIFLDYAYGLVWWRMVRRTIGRLVHREVLWADNREEPFRTFFTRDSIIWWMMTTWGKRRRDAEAAASNPELVGKVVLRFRTPGETERWIQGLESGCR